MRITQSLEQTQFVAQLDTLESNISTNQNDITTGLAFTTPAQNPIAAGTVSALNQTLAQSQQYTANASSGQTNLETESSTLSQVQTQLQSLYSLALEANSGTASTENLAALGAQATQIQSTLVSLANTQGGNGQYIFGGTATESQPFALTPTGASYTGDQGQPQVQIAAGQTVATGDNGDTVFNQITTGNGSFAVAAPTSNTGSGIVGATSVTDPQAFASATASTPNGWTISFPSATTYSIATNTATTPPTAAVTGTYASGQAIAFDGIEVTLTGQPTPATIASAGPPVVAATPGDTFTVAPSTKQSVFTTVQNLITALNTATTTPLGKTQLGNSIATAVNNLNQAISSTSTIEAQVGGRLNTITTQQSVATSQQLQLKTSISSLQSLDYAQAVTTLTAENTQLSASEQAFTLTQGLSLFKYIQG
jgi:flagellar hook-associated protein 3 FlgL